MIPWKTARPVFFHMEVTPPPGIETTSWLTNKDWTLSICKGLKFRNTSFYPHRGLISSLLRLLYFFGVRLKKPTKRSLNWEVLKDRYVISEILIPSVHPIKRNERKAFCLVSKISFTLRKACANLDFETKTAKVRIRSNEIYFLELGHSKFYKPNFGDFKVVNFPNL